MRKTEDIRIYFDELESSYSETSKSWKFAYNWIDSLVFALVGIAIVFTLLFRVVGVNGESMKQPLTAEIGLRLKQLTQPMNEATLSL